MRLVVDRLVSVAGLITVIVLTGCGGGGGGTDDNGTQDAFDGTVVPDPGKDASGPETTATVVTPVFDPASGDFFTLPFPGDQRVRADGTLNLADFPNPSNVGLLDTVLGVAEDVLDGFSVVQVAYFPFDGPLDTSGLPDTWVPGDPTIALQMVDVTEGSTYGERVPLIWEFRADEGLYYAANTLMFRPLWGCVLEEGHTYAALATSDLQGADGGVVEPAPAFLEALDGTLAGYDDLVTSLAPLKGLLDKEPDLAGRVVTGTVFTVGAPSAELRKIREYLWTSTDPPEMDPDSLAYHEAVTDISFYRYTGRYTAPNFLEGTPPYNEKGGFVFDAGGDPVVQADESMKYALIVPKKMDMPPDGWPIVVYSHGTGGDFDSFIKNPGINLAKEGLAVIGINQPLHGDRANLPKEILELYSFNFINVYAGRTVQRQSVPDNISLLRMIEAGNLVVPKETSGADREEKFDPSRIMFFGHSQGGLTGGMLFGVEDHFDGGVISGAGGGMPMTLVLRKDPIDLKVFVGEALEIDDPTEMTEFHPVLTVLQMLVDATDPIAYGESWFDFDTADPMAGPRNVMMTEGMLDMQTPSATAEALASAAGIPLLKPFWHNPDGMKAKGITPMDLPVSQNIDAGNGAKATGFLAQFDTDKPEDGHFVVFDSEVAQAYYREFLRTLAYDGIATVSQ